MSRELAGVVACLQEIEIACQKLTQKGGMDFPPAFADLRDLLKKFFMDVDIEKAERIQDHLEQMEREAESGGDGFHFFKVRVEVDAHLSSLADLKIELREVIEDLA